MNRLNSFYTSALLLLALSLAIPTTEVQAEPDPNFYIYLCFGQSNMEGQGTIEAQDQLVSTRFKMMATVSGFGTIHPQWKWSEATPPLCRQNNGLSPADYFGRYMVKYLPDSITIGVINVSIGGCSIDLFDKDGSKRFRDSISQVSSLQWQVNAVDAYDNSDPYGALIKGAKIAQESGVIKGFLLHQGETDAYSDEWIYKVRKIYNQLLDTLSLEASETPLIVGEVVHRLKGGVCATANNTIDKVPDFIENSAVVPSKACSCQSDNLHFDSAGYRKLGRLYAETLLKLIGYDYTSVESILEDGYTTKVIYNLQGQEISSPVKGVNIIDGKKYLIR